MIVAFPYLHSWGLNIGHTIKQLARAYVDHMIVLIPHESFSVYSVEDEN